MSWVPKGGSHSHDIPNHPIFQEAVAAQSTIAHELVEIPTVSRPEVCLQAKQI
jgi:hypothetical protein